MTLDQAFKIVGAKFGFLDAYCANGALMHVVAAERELRAMPEVNSPEQGIAIFTSEVMELARGAITVKELVRRKQPVLFRGVS
jgi:urease gamma subunit